MALHALVCVKNLSPGLQVYHNVFNKSVVVQPGDSRSIDMHVHHIRMFQRAVKKDPPLLELTLSPEAEEALEEYAGANKEAVAKRKPPFETTNRFITDPKTVPDGLRDLGERRGSHPNIPKNAPRRPEAEPKKRDVKVIADLKVDQKAKAVARADKKEKKKNKTPRVLIT